MNLIVYFHGYKSSPNSEKVKKIRSEFPNDIVAAFEAPIDPATAIKKVSDDIDCMMLCHNFRFDKIIFVGSSLGAWLAAELALSYGCQAILINPGSDPASLLKTLGATWHEAESYSKMRTDGNFTYVFAEHDEVIDNVEDFMYDMSVKGYPVHIIPNETHQFIGEGLEFVIKLIRKLLGNK